MVRSSEVLRRRTSVPSIVKLPYKSAELLKELVACLLFQIHLLKMMMMMMYMLLGISIAAIVCVGVA